MPKYSALKGWLDRTDPLQSFIDLEKRPPNQEFGGFLSLDEMVPAYESNTLPSESLSDSWEKTHSYVSSSLEIIHASDPLWLDNEEVEMIINELGEPPPICYPLYLISVESKGAERLVYVGKTSSSNGRFKGGHAALTKLLNPKYDGQIKRLYLAGVVLLADDKSLQPLEWVKPLARAEELLSSIESQLIFTFKPGLNTQHVKKNNASWPVSLHIQNFTETKFLNDEMC
jgi:hypothetical protein